MRPATEKERAFIMALRKPSPAASIVFALFPLLFGLAMPFTSSTGRLILAIGIVATAISSILAMKRFRIERGEVESMIVEETSGSIERVDRVKGMVSAIHVRGRRFTILDAEPVSEGTKVRIAFLPTSWRVVSLERIYDERP